VNGVSVYSRLEEVDESKISKSEYAIEAIDYVDSNMRGYKMLYVIDR
jgi:actin-related protein